MIRNFELQIYDDNDKNKLLDRFLLEDVVSPSGLGFKIKVETVATDVYDYIISKTIEKKEIKLTCVFFEPGAYLKTNNFRNWINKNYNKNLTLKYNDTTMDKFIDGIITSFELTEIDVYNSVPIVFKPVSPMYLKNNRTFIKLIENKGRNYPFSYPYKYGGGNISDPYLENKYFSKVPLTVRISGKVVNPEISLYDENNVIYSTVKFINLTIDNGEFLIIDAQQNRLLKINQYSITEDVYNCVDKTKQLFLFLNPGTSSIAINFNQNEPNAKAEIFYPASML